MGRLFGRTGIIGSEWLPTDLSDCELWLRSDYAYSNATKTSPCVNNDLIWVGADQSGNINDAIQATEANRLTYLTNQIGSYPSWQADDVLADWMGFTVITNIRSAFFVIKFNNANQAYAPLLGHPDLYDWLGGNYATVLSDTYASPNILNGSGWVNGVSTPPANMVVSSSFQLYEFVTLDNVSAQYISNDRNLSGRCLRADYVEIGLYSSPWSDADRLLLENYIRTRYPSLGM